MMFKDTAVNEKKKKKTQKQKKNSCKVARLFDKQSYLLLFIS